MFKSSIFLTGATILSLFHASNSVAGPTNALFQFESVRSFDEMSDFVREHFPPGSSRSNLRQVFVTEGRATLKLHPQDAGIEKYLYDINLCNYYVWRWNVSADYDTSGKLLQAYINGNALFSDGKPNRIVSKVAEPGKKASIYRMQRLRPEAYKGENSLGYILFDRDSNTKTIDDQVLMGTGPSRADPLNMGKTITYAEVDPWRSIFDQDSANQVVPYRGDCVAADSRTQNRKAGQ